MKIRPMLVACGATVLIAAATMGADRIIVEAILVRVNERVMTVSDFRERLQAELAQVGQPLTGEELKKFAREVFTTTVDELVLLEMAREKKLTIDDATIDQAIEDLREQNELQDDEAFQAALTGAGLTEEGLRQRYSRNMLLQRAVQSEIKPTEITEEEVRQQYEVNKEQYRVPAKVELDQVFFPVGPDASGTQVRRVAQGLVDRVREGSDLRAEATLAGAEIQELGAIPVEDLRPVIQNALDSLGEEGVTDPLDTAGGYLVVHLIRRIPAGYESFDEVAESIRRQLSQEAYKDQTQGMVERLKDDYLVEVHEDRFELILAQVPAS